MTEWFTAALVVGLGIVVSVCCAALVEVFRQISEIRRAGGLDDQPITIDLPSAGLSVADVGLPPRIGELSEAILVFLHSRCGTCRAVAETFRPGSPASLWFVVPAQDLLESDAFEALAASHDRVIADSDDGIATALGLEVAPAVVTIQSGVVQSAVAVSTAKQVYSLISHLDLQPTMAQA